MPSKKTAAEKPKVTDAAAKVLSRHGLYLVGGELVWRPESDAPRGIRFAKIAEHVEEDDGLGSEGKITWEFPMTDAPQHIVRQNWIERWPRRYKFGWLVRQRGRWGKWSGNNSFPNPPQTLPAPEAIPFREYWWSATGRHRTEPSDKWCARARYFRAGKSAFVREDILVIPPASKPEPLSATLKRLARTWQEKPWPDSTVEHPDSTPTHMRRVPNPAFWRRQGVISGLHQLAHGLEAGMDPEMLVRVALGVGADLAKLGQEPLIPAVRHIQTLKERNQGRTPSAATAQLLKSAEEFTKQQWGKNPRISAAAVMRRLEKAVKANELNIGSEHDPDGTVRYYDTKAPEALSWTPATMLRRIYEALKRLAAK